MKLEKPEVLKKKNTNETWNFLTILTCSVVKFQSDTKNLSN